MPLVQASDPRSLRCTRNHHVLGLRGMRVVLTSYSGAPGGSGVDWNNRRRRDVPNPKTPLLESAPYGDALCTDLCFHWRCHWRFCAQQLTVAANGTLPCAIRSEFGDED
jgi:hypothetical protein